MKPGRPKKGEKRELTKLSFLADEETMTALLSLEDSVDGTTVARPRGEVIRKAIQAAARVMEDLQTVRK